MAVLLGAGVLMAGCRPGEPIPDERTEAPLLVTDTPAEGPDPLSRSLPSREQFVTRALLLPGRTRAELAAALGRPDSILSQVVPNRHVSGAMDTLFAVFYPGLSVGIHRPGPGGELLSSAEAWDDRFLRYSVIGVTREAIIESFGPPDETAVDSLTYRCTTCVAGDDPVTLILGENRVNRVRFSFYVD